MKKEHIVKALAEYIKSRSEQESLAVTDNGTGKAFDGSFWEGVFKDDSNIPNIIAKNDTEKIELRSFWGSPELDISTKLPDGRSVLQVLNFSDGAYRPKEMSDSFSVDDIRGLMEKGVLIQKGRDIMCHIPEKTINYHVLTTLTMTNPERPEKTEYEMLNEVRYSINRYFMWDDFNKNRVKAAMIEGLTEFYHTEDFEVREIRADGAGLDSCKALISELYEIAERVQSRCKELEKNKKKGRGGEER